MGKGYRVVFWETLKKAGTLLILPSTIFTILSIYYSITEPFYLFLAFISPVALEIGIYQMLFLKDIGEDIKDIGKDTSYVREKTDKILGKNNANDSQNPHPNPYDNENGEKKKKEEKEIETSGAGALGGMVTGGTLGLLGGPIGVIIGGVAGAIVGDQLEYQQKKAEKARKEKEKRK